MASLWRRTSSERQTLGEVPGLAAKKLRNTLSGNFLAKLGSKDKHTPQGSGDFTIQAFPGPEARVQPSAHPAPAGQGPTEGDVNSVAREKLTAVTADVHGNLASSDAKQKDAMSPNADAKEAQSNLSGLPNSAQQQSDQAANLELEASQPNTETYTEELQRFLQSTPNEKAHTLMKLKSLKVEKPDTRKLQRGVSYADEALDSMTALLSSEGNEDRQSKSPGWSPRAMGKADTASMASRPLADTTTRPHHSPDDSLLPVQPDASRDEVAAMSVSTAAQEDAESVQSGSKQTAAAPPTLSAEAVIKPNDQLEQDKINGEQHAEVSSSTMTDAQQTLMPASSTLRSRQVRRGESYADELLGALTSETSTASDKRPPDDSNETDCPESREDQDSTTLAPAESTVGLPAPEAVRRQGIASLRRGESYADELAFSLTSEASNAGRAPQSDLTAEPEVQVEANLNPETFSHIGSSSQPAQFQPRPYGSVSMQKRKVLKRGESYADEVIAMLSSETSGGLADADPAEITSALDQSGPSELSSLSWPGNDSPEMLMKAGAREDTNGAKNFPPTNSLVRPDAASPQDVDAADTESGQSLEEPVRPSLMQAPSRQPSSKALRRGDSYADEVLNDMLAEGESSSLDDNWSRSNPAGLPTIMEGEQIAAPSLAQAQEMDVPPGNSCTDSERPPSRHGTAEQQPDAGLSPAAEQRSQPSLDMKTSDSDSASLPVVSSTSADPQAAWSAGDDGLVITGQGLPSQEEVSASVASDEPAVGIINHSTGDAAAAEGGSYAEILSLPQDEDEAEVDSNITSAMIRQQAQEDAFAPSVDISDDAMMSTDEALRIVTGAGPAASASAADFPMSRAPPAAEAANELHLMVKGDDTFIQDDPAQALDGGKKTKEQPDDGQPSDPQKLLPGIADAADQQARVIHARLSRSLSATGKAARILHKTAAYVRRTASITRSIPILPSQQSQMEEQRQDTQPSETQAAGTMRDSPTVQEASVGGISEASMHADSDASPAKETSLPIQDPDYQLQQSSSFRGDQVDKFAENRPEADTQSQQQIFRTGDSRYQRSYSEHAAQNAQPSSTQPASIDEDALPALQSPAVTSPSPPQPLEQSVSPPAHDLNCSSELPIGQQQESALVLGTRESQETGPFNQLGGHNFAAPTSSSLPDELRGPGIRQSTAHNASSQTQVTLDMCIMAS